MTKFWSQIRLTQSDMRGAITICITLILVAVIVVLNIKSESEAASEVLNNERIAEAATTRNTIHIREFDPNTVELRELLNMGFDKSVAVSLLRYRATGKIFRIKEEVIGCYGISDSLYFAIEPYIVIGEEFQYKGRTSSAYTQSASESKPQTRAKTEAKSRPKLTPSPFLIDTVGVEYLAAIGALTYRQAEVFVKWRKMSGIESLDELKACYTVSDSIAEWMAQYAIFTPKKREYRDSTKVIAPAKQTAKKELIELNSADSATLVSIYGIGAKTASAIVEYREKLGGFHSKEQLLEIKIIFESNFEKIIKQISVDNSVISKIDVNFATAKQLSSHPYFTPLKIRRLLKIRELKGGWRTIEEMIDSNIFTKEEAQRVHPYLHFEVQDPIIE